MAMESTLTPTSTGAGTRIDTPNEPTTTATNARTTYNIHITSLRAQEYPMLTSQIYLDHAGTTPPSTTLLTALAQDLSCNLYGNPHSFGSASSQHSAARIDDIRLKVLSLVDADPAAFDVVFVANATAGVKLVAEGFAACEGGFAFVYHCDAHTSVVGVRELAGRSFCLERDDEDGDVEELFGSLVDGDGCESSLKLFAWPAQSNMNGRRLPLAWSGLRQPRSSSGISDRMYTLLDAAAFVPTSALHFPSVDVAPDFTVVSFYKIFGFPDLGAVIVRKDAGDILLSSRKYFGGGTVETVSCTNDEQWHFKKNGSIHDSLEDGTLPIHNIIALGLAIDIHDKLFGGIDLISKHTSFLANTMFKQLKNFKHGNDAPVFEIYRDSDKDSSYGPILAFNLLDISGNYVSHQEVQKLASIRNIHLRTGNLCNPGGVSRALNMNAKDLMDNYSAGLRCGSDQDIIGGKPTGVIRVSFGAMSNLNDVEAFISFIREFFVEDVPLFKDVCLSTERRCKYYVESLVVYPIKSCGGYNIPRGVSWPIRSQGLAWDREWCLIHQGTRLPLSQKRYGNLALFKPVLDLERGLMIVKWTGPPSTRVADTVLIPLALDLSLQHGHRESQAFSYCPTNLCGNNIEPLIYRSSLINDFFSIHLDVPVYLARIPLTKSNTDLTPSSTSSSSRNISSASVPTPPPSPPCLPSNETGLVLPSMSLANESPILILFQSSLDQVNSLLPEGMQHIPKETFRANIILNSIIPSSSTIKDSKIRRNTETPCQLPLKFAEDDLSILQFDHQSTTNPKKAGLKLLAPCRRCQMIASDQNTGQRRPEVFAHMARIRRWNGGVWFGVHALLDVDGISDGGEISWDIHVGDAVLGM